MRDFPGAIQFAFPFLPKVKAVFTTAVSGNFSLEAGLPETETIATRKRLAKAAKIDDWVEMRQVHGDTLLVEPFGSGFSSSGLVEADGVCTERRGFALVVKTADCQPLLLAHKSGSHIAALHVGWRGNAINFPASGVKSFCDAYSLDPADILVARGPSLGPSKAEFVNYKTDWPQEFHRLINPDTKTMDLWTLTDTQLTAAGILPKNIFRLDLCTASLPGFLFSHRNKHTARQASLIWRE